MTFFICVDLLKAAGSHWRTDECNWGRDKKKSYLILWLQMYERAVPQQRGGPGGDEWRGASGALQGGALPWDAVGAGNHCDRCLPLGQSNPRGSQRVGDLRLPWCIPFKNRTLNSIMFAPNCGWIQEIMFWENVCLQLWVLYIELLDMVPLR